MACVCCCHSCQLDGEMDHNKQTVVEGDKGGLLLLLLCV